MCEPTITHDGRYIVVDGRRWRATDPLILESRRAELVQILMAWRREVRRTKGTAEESITRAGVPPRRSRWVSGTPPWWDQDDEHRRARWQAEMPEPR